MKLNKYCFTLSLLILASCDMGNVSNTDSFQPESSSESVYDEYDYINEKPIIKQVSSQGEYVSFSNSSSQEKLKIASLLEEYICNNHLGGIPVATLNTTFVKISDRVNIKTNPLLNDKNEPVVIDGTIRYDSLVYDYSYPFYEFFKIISQGSISGILDNVTEYENYFHTNIDETITDLNYMNLKEYDSDCKIISDYTNTSYFIQILSEDKTHINYIPSLASEENKLSDGNYGPLPLKVNEDGTKTLIEDATYDTFSKYYRVYVKTGHDLVYNTLSTNEAISRFVGREVSIDDYITTIKQKNSGINNFSGFGTLGIIEGMRAYNSCVNPDELEALWENVGIKTGNDSKGDYIDFTFAYETLPCYAIYHFSEACSAPIPQEFFDVIGGANNLGSFATSQNGDSLTPVDTLLSVGPYILKEYNEKESIVLAKNPLSFKDDKYNLYSIDGIYFHIISDKQAYHKFLNNELDFALIPEEYEQEEMYKANTQEINGNSNFSLNVNSCSTETWIELFGENGTISQTEKDDYWDIKPAMSNDDFLKGLTLSINRQDFAYQNGGTPNINLLNPSKLFDPNTEYPYNKTKEHHEALLSYFGSEELIYKNGYDLDVARQYFSNACDSLLADGLYNEGDVIEIEICFQTEEQVRKYGSLIKDYLETAFNHESVCNNLLTLSVINTYTEVWSDIYYEKMMCGKFDLAYGGLGGTSNFIYDFEKYKSNNSSGFTLNWGEDTNSADKVITYNGKKYTYDALYKAVETFTIVEPSGKEATLFDAILLSNIRDNETGNRKIIIQYSLANIEDVVKVSIQDIELYSSNKDDGHWVSELLNEYAIYNNDETITIDLPEEIIKNHQEEVSFYFTLSIETEYGTTYDYIDLETMFLENKD